MIKTLLFFIFAGLAALIFSCSDPTSGTVENLPPDTHLSLYPDSIIAPGSTLKRISWWGDDPDGLVKGFRISFDSVNWGFTTKNDSTFILSINGTDSTFRFFVAAVDDKGLIDPTPATNLYPVFNTPPNISFDAGFDIPETTFAVATFKWSGTDPDGNETIRYYQYSIGDTNHFKRIPGTINVMTLTKDSGIVVNSNNIFYIRAEDNAGALSPTIRMPDTSATWFVKPVTSRILMIRDLTVTDQTFANPYFANAFDTIHYDLLDIKVNNGALIPKIVNPMFVNTLKLFDIVFWTAGNNSPASAANFDLATQSLPFYIQGGGKVFFSSGFLGPLASIPPFLENIAPIDSVSSCVTSIVGTNQDFIVTDPSYPTIGTNSLIFALRGLRVTTASIIYQYNSPACGLINIGIKDSPINPKIVYFDFPVYSTNKDPVASKQLFRKIFISEFGY